MRGFKKVGKDLLMFFNLTGNVLFLINIAKADIILGDH
jgi:hypothetical protein